MRLGGCRRAAAASPWRLHRITGTRLIADAIYAKIFTVVTGYGDANTNRLSTYIHLILVCRQTNEMWSAVCVCFVLSDIGACNFILSEANGGLLRVFERDSDGQCSIVTQIIETMFNNL